MNQADIIKQWAAKNGAKGGKVGGASKSEAKKKSSAANLAKARKKRWGKKA